jgi:HEAT repeat protein
LKSKDVGPIAAKALAMIGDKRAIKPLTAVLHDQDQDDEFRKAAEKALDSIKKGIQYFPID